MKFTIERIEKDALERYHLQELVTNVDLLRRAEPSQSLLKAILHTIALAFVIFRRLVSGNSS